MANQAIPRADASALGPEQFARDYGRPGLPVILRGVFAGQPIMDFSSAHAVIHAFGDETLNCVDQQAVQMSRWVRDFFAGRRLRRAPIDPVRVRHETIRAYFAGPASVEPRGSARPIPAVPHQLHGPTPAPIRALYEVPPCCERQLYPWCRADAVASLRPERMHLVFFGRRGHVADLHQHRDLFHLLFHQVFGRKRVVLMPPGAAHKLAPVLSMSGLALERLSASEFAHFLAYTSGVVDVLEPGETLFLPAGWWHYFDYLDDCMSINMRFAEPDDPDIQFLLAASPDYRVRRVAYELREPDVFARHRHDLARIRAIGETGPLGVERRYRAFMCAVDALAARLAPGESHSHVELNDVVDGHCGSLFSPGVSPWRVQAMALVRRLGYRLAAMT